MMLEFLFEHQLKFCIATMSVLILIHIYGCQWLADILAFSIQLGISYGVSNYER